jgi:hypothetical protein
MWRMRRAVAHIGAVSPSPGQRASEFAIGAVRWKAKPSTSS